MLANVWSFVRGIVDAPRVRQLGADDENLEAGPYTLEQKIGQGGMGVVYRAHHVLQSSRAAVKLLARAGTHDARRARLFAREIDFTSRLRHPNIISVYDWGSMPDGTLYYAMEYVEGSTLADLIARDGAQSAARVIHLLRQVAGALEEVHAMGLVHRDIKPSNLMVNGGDVDQIKVLDFGLVTEARSSASHGEHSHSSASGEGRAFGRLPTASPHVLMGTPLYMAPEAIENPEDVDGRADLYALGAVGYFLLTGGSTFEGTTTLVEACMKQLFEDPVRPSLRTTQRIPSELEDLIMACLARDPNARPRSAAEVARRLDRIVAASA